MTVRNGCYKVFNMATKVYGIRLNDEDKKTLEEEASRNHLTVAEYVRHLARLKVDLKMTIKRIQARK